MVNKGPSQGCIKCRQRHVKCDQGKPECGNCDRLGLSCPGYRQKAETRFKDETESVTKRWQLQKYNAQSPQPLQRELVLARCTSHDSLRESMYINLFIEAYAPPPAGNCFTSRGHLNLVSTHLTSSWQNASFSRALRWLAAVTVGVVPSLRRKDAELSWYGGAIAAVRQALSKPNDLQDEATFLAIVMLEFGQRILSVRWNGPSKELAMHQTGLEALVHHRLKHGMINSISPSLLSAARANAIDHSLASRQKRLNPIWRNFEGDDTQPLNAAQDLDRLGLGVLLCRETLEAAQPMQSSDDFANHVQRLDACYSAVHQWRQQVPEALQPLRKASGYDYYPSIGALHNMPSNSKPSAATNLFSTPSKAASWVDGLRVANLFNQWRTLLLVILVCQHKLKQSAKNVVTTPTWDQNAIIAEIDGILTDVLASVPAIMKLDFEAYRSSLQQSSTDGVEVCAAIDIALLRRNAFSSYLMRLKITQLLSVLYLDGSGDTHSSNDLRIPELEKHKAWMGHLLELIDAAYPMD